MYAFDFIHNIYFVSQPVLCERTQYIIVITVEICKRHNRLSVFRFGKRPPVGDCWCRLVLISMQMNRRRQILTTNCRRPKMSRRNNVVIIAVSALRLSPNDSADIAREFIRQYHTSLAQDRNNLYRFYSSESTLLHEGLFTSPKPITGQSVRVCKQFS
jgi:hypothetical protein